MQPDGANDFVDIGGGSQWIIDDFCRASDLSIDAVLGFYFLRLMMNQDAKFAFLFARAAADDEQRDPLGEGPGDGVHHIMSAGAVSDTDHTDPTFRPSVAIGGKADPGLMGEGHDLEPSMPAELEK